MIKKFFLYMLLPMLMAGACSNEPKKLSIVQKGMTSQMVFDIMGMPSSKNNIGDTEVWTYPDSNRVVVFRKDTVYRIYTSPKARIDTLGKQLGNAGESAASAINDAAKALEDAGKQVKQDLHKDSIFK